MNYLYSFSPFDNRFVISYPYKMTFEDWFNLNRLNIFKSIELTSNYGNVFLYIDHIFLKFFKDNLKNYKVNYIPLNYKKSQNIWCDSKFNAISNFIKYKKEPFVHIDFDLFLTKDIFKNEIPELCISFKEEGPAFTHYKKYREYFTKNRLSDLANFKIDYAYNCSIVGGKDLKFLKIWVENTFNLIKKYDHVLNNFNYNKYLLSSIFEQLHLAYLTKNYNVTELIKYNNNHVMHLAEPNNKGEWVVSNIDKKIIIHDKCYGAEVIQDLKTRNEWYVLKNKIEKNSEYIFN